jgi:hypothetical protein
VSSSRIPISPTYSQYNSLQQTPNLSNPNVQSQQLIEQHVKNKNDDMEIDWITWILALLALITLGGLIPFWLWVYYQLNPPI